jgi:hypothetical protein
VLYHNRVACYADGSRTLGSFRLIALVTVEAFSRRGRSQWAEIYLAHLLRREGRGRHCGVCVGHYVLAIEGGAWYRNNRGLDSECYALWVWLFKEKMLLLCEDKVWENIE